MNDQTPDRKARITDLRKTEQALPIKLSEVVRTAVADLRAGISDGTLSYDPLAWHQPGHSKDAPCRVCLAGAVLRRHGIKDDELADHSGIVVKSNYHANEEEVARITFPHRMRSLMLALNLIRRGHWIYAWEVWHETCPDDEATTTALSQLHQNATTDRMKALESVAGTTHGKRRQIETNQLGLTICDQIDTELSTLESAETNRNEVRRAAIRAANAQGNPGA